MLVPGEARETHHNGWKGKLEGNGNRSSKECMSSACDSRSMHNDMRVHQLREEGREGGKRVFVCVYVCMCACVLFVCLLV